MGIIDTVSFWRYTDPIPTSNSIAWSFGAPLGSKVERFYSIVGIIFERAGSVPT
jgi:hypothetical protein